MVLKMAKYNSQGWHFQSKRHSDARKTGHAGGKYANLSTAQLRGKIDANNTVAYMSQSYNKKLALEKLFENQEIALELQQRIKYSKDSDGDGVPDKMDCAPKNPNKQHTFTKVQSPIPMEELANKLETDLKEKGFKVHFYVDGNKLKMGNVRIDTEKRGHNINAFSGRRGNILGWQDWVEVNNQINKTLDDNKVSAKVGSLAGKFKVRDGTTKYTEDDWQDLAGENVGSIMNPIRRENMWTKAPEKEKKAPKIPKTKEEFVIQGNYGSGWEDVTSEDKWSEAKARLREYQENEPQYAHRRITRRIPNPQYKKEGAE
jgi:hypothetical protein